MLERRFVQTSPYESRAVLVEYFDDDLAPLGGPDHVFEPGHHFEWAWLLGEYARLSGESCHFLARKLWDSAMLLGFGEHGTIFDEVAASGRVVSAGTRLWPYAECMKAFNLAFPLPPDASIRRRDEIVGRLLSSFIVSAHPGTWFEHFDESGRLKRDNVPASSLYHLCCAIDQCDAVPERCP